MNTGWELSPFAPMRTLAERHNSPANDRRVNASDRRVNASDRRVNANDRSVNANDRSVNANDRRVNANNRRANDDGGERGFTLIELMIVVAIIAILAGILIPNFVNARAQAQTSACESNLRAIATAMELYYADNQRYPDAGAIPDALNTATVTYLSNTPRDPADASATPAKYTFTVPTGDGQSYLIACPGTHAASTLAKINKDDGAGKSSGTLCGAAGCTKSIEYGSGTGLLAK